MRLLNFDVGEFISIVKVVIEIMKRRKDPKENEKFSRRMLNDFLAFAYLKQESGEDSSSLVNKKKDNIVESFLSFHEIFNIDQEILKFESSAAFIDDIDSI